MRAAQPLWLTVHYDQGPDWQLPTVEVLWRCEGCGKWSHAKRRPTSHERFIPEGSDQPLPPNDDVLDERPTEYDREGGVVSLGGLVVRCGPFRKWIAGRAT